MNTPTVLEPVELRKTLLTHGYVPLPANGKAVYLKRWTAEDLAVDEALIDRWAEAGKSTEGRGDNHAIRCDGLVAIDIDVTDPGMCRVVVGLCASMLGPVTIARTGRAPKVLVLYRRATRAGGRKRQTGKWSDGAGDGHAVEVLTGRGCQFVAYGTHPGTGQGYRWTAASHPLVTPRRALARVSDEAVEAFLKEVRELFRGAGWVYASSETVGGVGEEAWPRVFDLTDDSEVEVASGELEGVWNVAHLERALRGRVGEGSDAETLRVVTGTSATHADSGSAGLCGDGFLRVVDYVENVVHLRPADERKARAFVAGAEEATEAAIERLAGIALDKEAFWTQLCERWVYVASENLYFDQLYPEVGEVQAALEVRARGWQWEGAPMLRAWKESGQCRVVAGRVFQPTMKHEPIVVRDGRRYLNTYVPTDWSGVVCEEADGAIWDEFMEHLVPARDEREFVWDWLAHKVQHPEARMVGLVMVAERMGTGRGTLVQLLGRLLGAVNVREVKHHKFMGKGSQGAFYDWLLGTLIVAVPELFTEDMSYRSRAATYERVKEIVDPGMVGGHLDRKYAKSLDSRVFASVMLCTNHGDGVAMLDGDRRLAVVEGGERMSEAFRVRLHGGGGVVGALADDRAVAALWRRLSGRVVKAELFSTPPMTAAKARMLEASKSDLTLAFERFVEVTGALALSIDQFKLYCAVAATVSDLEVGDAEEVARALRGGFLRDAGFGHDRTHINRVDGRQHRVWVARSVGGEREDAEWRRDELARVDSALMAWCKAEGRG